ncbi:retinal maintenance-domain-containing protein [Neocallimastix sp. 'constans']
MSYIFKSDVDDDIESLLKELELEQDTLPKNKSFNLNSDFSKYNNDSKKTDSDDLKKSKSNIKFENNKNKSSLNNESNALNSNIPDTDLLNDKFSLNNKTSGYEYSSSKRKAKCTTVCIGGQDGITIGNNQKSCNKLRCTSCDFNCIYFKDCEWSKNVDYLFFRNFVPNKEKLSKELIPKKECTSICCQCTWITVHKTTPITSIRNKKIKWVCGGHLMN